LSQYATQSEFLDQFAQVGTFQDLPGATIDAALVWASARVDSYIKKRVTLPLVSYSEDIKDAAVNLAGLRLLRRRGIDPASGNNQSVIDQAEESLVWLKDIAKGACEIAVYVDSTPAVDEAGPLASSDDLTDWQYTTRGSDDCDDTSSGLS
jgi:phage gp36-like protein